MAMSNGRTYGTFSSFIIGDDASYAKVKLAIEGVMRPPLFFGEGVVAPLLAGQEDPPKFLSFGLIDIECLGS
jgi:hypothetical protein